MVILFGVFVAVTLGLAIGIIRGIAFALGLAVSGVVVWTASYFAAAILMSYMPQTVLPSAEGTGRRFFDTLIICPTIVTFAYCALCVVLTRSHKQVGPTL